MQMQLQEEPEVDEFLRKYCRETGKGRVYTAVLHNAFNLYLQSKNCEPLSVTEFGKHLSTKCRKKLINNATCYMGIELIDKTEEQLEIEKSIRAKRLMYTTNKSIKPKPEIKVLESTPISPIELPETKDVEPMLVPLHTALRNFICERCGKVPTEYTPTSELREAFEHYLDERKWGITFSTRFINKLLSQYFESKTHKGKVSICGVVLIRPPDKQVIQA